MGKNTLRVDLLVVPQRRRRDLCTNQISNAPRHRRDVVPVTVSARWRGGFTLSTRRCPHDRVSPMAWSFTKVSAIILRIT